MMTRTLTALSALCLVSSAFAQEPTNPTTTTPKTLKVKPAPTPVQGKVITPKLKMPNGKTALKAPKSVFKEHALSGAKDEAPLPPVTGKDGLIAKVNGVGIKLSEFKTPYGRFEKTFKDRKRKMPTRLAQRYRRTIAKRLVDEELIRQEAKRLGIAPTAEQLNEELTSYKAMFKTEERFTKYLASANLTEDKVKENLTQGLLLKLLLERAKIGQVSDDQVRAQYEKQKAKYEEKEKVRASHILIKVAKGATPEQVAAAKAKADKLSAQAKAGEDFAALAKANSEGPTASRGGDLNFFARGRMVKEFDAKVFSMKVGEVSEPVRTRFGWHVIKVTDHKDAKTRTFDEVKENLRKMLEGRSKRKARSELLKGLTEKANVEIFLPADTKSAPIKLTPKK
jgi:peptidyl-prolyl cis-trans isomerase C